LRAKRKTEEEEANEMFKLEASKEEGRREAKLMYKFGVNKETTGRGTQCLS
jgi:hypothetical protein